MLCIRHGFTITTCLAVAAVSEGFVCTSSHGAAPPPRVADFIAGSRVRGSPVLAVRSDQSFSSGQRAASRPHPSRRRTARSSLAMFSPAEVTDATLTAREAISASLPSLLLGEEASIGYSKFSYYTTLGLYALSFPGLWSVVKRATKTKYKDATYEIPGPASSEEGAESVKQTAAKIIAYFQANNYRILNAGEEITFEGAVEANKGQAFFLVFCTALSFATLALVLQIQFPAIGNYWFLLTLLSPYAGVYYWQNASRSEKAKVRLETSEDDMMTELYITGAEEELDRLSKTMGFMEKGKIRIKGFLEQEPAEVPVPVPPAAVNEPAPQETEA
ncbi:unnamed protein product [Ascophyllum nodosum]